MLIHGKNLSLLDADKQFAIETLRNFVADIYERIQHITSFYEKYNRIYIKYKHIFSPLIGTIYKDEKNGLEIPRIFLRDMDEKKNTKNTYILSTDNETIRYYEKLGDDISTVFSVLLDCHVHSILNYGRDFLIPDIHFSSNDKKYKWLEIVRKVNTFTGIPPLTLRINVKETIRQQMLEGLAKDHILKYDQDILEHKENSFRLDHIQKK